MGDQTQLEAANQIGISKSNITRWKDGARAAPDFVVKVARAYGANVIEALVEAEFITEEEADLREVRVGGLLLSESNDDELVGEVRKRLTGRAELPVDELAARRSNMVTPDVHRLPYSADSSEIEPEMGDDDYHDGP